VLKTPGVHSNIYYLLLRGDKKMPGTSVKEKWIEITLTAPVELSDALSNFLTELGSQGVIEEEREIDAFEEEPIEPAALAEIKAYLPGDIGAKKQIASLKKYIDSIAKIFPGLEKPTLTTNTIVDPDWNEQWKKYFKPLRISKDIIKPTWERYAPLGRDIVIDIDPGMAFGTGQHPSTRMCIIALEEILTQHRDVHKWEVIDVGTGTGILAISSAKLGVGKIIAVDLDPKAVEIAGKNITINEVEDKVEIINRDITMCKGTFDLVMANISANALLDLQPHLIKLIKTDGYIILSGIIDRDAKNIETIYHTGDIALHNTLSEKEWVCYVFQKRSKDS
jgi:ribosomal protein L11 methyltransferase